MQFFPATTSPAQNISSADIAGGLLNAASDALGLKQTPENGFSDILSSFIEEDRTDYSGRPPGFAAYGAKSGTLDQNVTSKISQELRKRKVDEESISRLEALVASGSPVTIGTVLNAVAGKSRLTAVLEGEERDSLKLLLGKLGFSKDEQDEFLSLSDEGDTRAMWKRLSEKLDKLDSRADLSKDEWSRMLKGLDVSARTAKTLHDLFGPEAERALSGGELKNLLTHVGREYARREETARFTQTQMRAAVEEVLKNAKTEALGKPVEDTRGNRRSEQTEALMQDSARRNTGSDQIKKEPARQHEHETAEHEKAQEEHLEDLRDGKNRSERILRARESESPESAASRGERAGESGADKLLHRLEAVVDMPRQNPAAPQGQTANLDNLAGKYRQEIFSQVEQGLLQSAQNGGQRLTLQLNPAELGQITVVLSMHQGEMKATIRAENQDSAAVLREQMADLKLSLEEQGIKVKELDVQTGLNDRSLAGQWDGAHEHNLLRDADERARRIRLTRVRREAGAGDGAVQEQVRRHSDGSRLHIVA